MSKSIKRFFLMTVVIIICIASTNAEEITLTTIMPVGGLLYKVATNHNNPGGTTGDLFVAAGATVIVNVPGIDVKYVVLGGGWNYDGNWSGRHGIRVASTANGSFSVSNNDLHDEMVISWMAIGY